MSEERNQYAVVPFDTFERYLGPRYENVPGVEFILENGTLLYFMEEAPGVYESADHTVTGEPAAPKLFVPVYEGDEMQPHAFAEVGPREQFAAITDFSVTIGLPGVNQRGTARATIKLEPEWTGCFCRPGAFLSRSGIRMVKSSRFWNASRSVPAPKTWSL